MEFDPQAIEETMLRLTTERGAGKTICPSEVARAADAARSPGGRAPRP